MNKLGFRRSEIGRLTIAEFLDLFDAYKKMFNLEKNGTYAEERKIDSIFDIVGR